MISIDLTGKTALITGGGQGLGQATARRLHQAGAKVVVNYLPDPQGHNEGRARHLTNDLGERALLLPADVRSLEEVEEMFRLARETFGRIDIAVNNAGILRDRTVQKMDTSSWTAILDTNLTGVFHVCKVAASHLTDGGRIVNLASISGSVGFFGQGNYAAAKAGVVGLTKVLSRELARRRITVNAVAPGVVLTDMGQSIPENVREKMLENIPLGRFGEETDVANAILYLCSDLASYVTGQTLHVNGGWWSGG